MMKNTFKILFYIKRNALLRNGRAPIMVRITVDGERVQMSTQHSVAPDKWCTQQGRVGGRSDDARRTNLALEMIRTRIGLCYQRLTAGNETITALKIKEMYTGGDNRRQMLLAFFRHHNEQFARMVGVIRSSNTYSKYRCVYAHLERFVAERYGCDDIPFSRIDTMFVTEFQAYISRHKAHKTNTVWVYMIALKHIMALAQNLGYMNRNPFCNHRLRAEFVARNYLSMDEIRHLIGMELPAGNLRTVHELFLFSCFTGLSYIDMRNLKFENLQNIDGEIWINTARCKTGTAVSVRLFELPRSILMRHAEQRSSGTIFDMPSNGWCNNCLRRIMQMAGIGRRITFHSARHTFATSITLSQGVAIETISKLLGHKNIRTTQIYASITHSHLRDEMNMLSRRVDMLNRALAAAY